MAWEIIKSILFLVIGIFGLIKGADFFVDSASSIAKRFKISPLIIGLTIVAIGTSLPELAVSLTSSISAFKNGTTADISLGNVIGSNIANIGLVLGCSLLILPISIKETASKFELVILFLSALLLCIFSFFFNLDKVIDRWEAIILFLLFIVYMTVLIIKTIKKQPSANTSLDEKKEENVSENKEEIKKEKPLYLVIIFLILGAAMVVIGGILVTNGAENLSIKLLSDVFGVDQTKAKTLIGLSVVSVGTSLPELVTSLVAAKKKENEISFGNIIGSNISNTLLIVGLCGTVYPLGVNADVMIDSLICLGITVFILLLYIFTKEIHKKTGIALLGIYILYLTYIILRALNIIPNTFV